MIDPFGANSPFSLFNRLAFRLALLALACLCSYAFGRLEARQDCQRSRQLEQQVSRIAGTDQLRQEEHHEATVTLNALDQYAVRQAERTPAVRATRADLVRVRLLLAPLAAPAGEAAPADACRPDPRLAGLAQLLDEGAGLVEEGARVADELRDQRDGLAALAASSPARAAVPLNRPESIWKAPTP